MTVKRYASLNTARRMTSLRSRNAAQRGEYSQFTIVIPIDGEMYHAGPTYDVQQQFPDYAPVAQYSAGYSC